MWEDACLWALRWGIVGAVHVNYIDDSVNEDDGDDDDDGDNDLFINFYFY